MPENITNMIEDNAPVRARGSVLADFEKGEGLLPAEEELRTACMRGDTCRIGDGKRPNVATRENTIRASFLRYLILGGCKDTPLHQRGLKLYGAFIACRETAEFGKCLDLQSADITQDVTLANCQIDGSIILYGAKTKTLNLLGSSIAKLEGDGVAIDGNIYMRNGFKASGEVRLLGAKINGVLDCSGARFDTKGNALICDGMETDGNVFLNSGFQAAGEVRLLGAKISGVLDCSGASFDAKGNALLCDGMETGGDVFLRNDFQATGEVRLLGAKIAGDLTCRNGRFKKNLIAQNAGINGNVFLDEGFSCHGTVYLPNATIGGNLFTNNATFFSRDQAIHANKAIIEGNVTLGGVDSAGTLAFQSATIHGDFSANGAILSGKPCIDLRNANISGTFHWRDIKHANGRLNLGGAKAKTINMDMASWQKPHSVKLNNFEYLGFESLEAGTGSEYWKAFLARQPERDLTARFRPRPFEHLAGVLASTGYEEEARAIRIERQHRQTEFMARHDPDLTFEGPDGEQHIRYLHRLNIFFRRFISGPLVDYGYRPGKAFLFLFGLILVGQLIFWKAAGSGIMAPTHPLIYKEAANGFIPKKCADNWVYFPKLSAEDIKGDPEGRTQCHEFVPSEYSEFQSLIYSADIALPIVDLRMESDWSPRVVYPDGTRDWLGWSVRLFEWFAIISGWLLSLLFVSAVGGIIRR